MKPYKDPDEFIKAMGQDAFQERIDQILAKKLLAAAADTNAKTICLAGGVAANGHLRLNEVLDIKGYCGK